MTSLDERIHRVIGARITNSDIREAYTIDHTYGGEHFVSTVQISCGPNDDIEIRGKFSCTNDNLHDAGNFFRTIYRRDGLLRVHHNTIVVAPKHRDKNIATAHYTKALAFYYSIGVAAVGMEANQDGPTVWPGFSFELVNQGRRDHLQAIVRSLLLEHIPAEKAEALLASAGDYTPLLAAIEIETPDGEAVSIGLQAMRQLYAETGEELRMVAWLDKPVRRAYLEMRGILEPERPKE